MAFETSGGDPISLPASTGLKRYRFVTVNTSGNLAYPALGDPVAGVLVSSGTTGSTRDTFGTLQHCGVAKVEAVSGTLAVGALVQATSVGYAKATTGGSYAVGRVVAGTSGGSGRVLSVLLQPIGTT